MRVAVWKSSVHNFSIVLRVQAGASAWLTASLCQLPVAPAAAYSEESVLHQLQRRRPSAMAGRGEHVRRGDAALESQAGPAWPAQPRGSAQTAHRDAGERSQNPSIAALFAVFKVLGCVLGVF